MVKDIQRADAVVGAVAALQVLEGEAVNWPPLCCTGSAKKKINKQYSSYFCSGGL